MYEYVRTILILLFIKNTRIFYKMYEYFRICNYKERMFVLHVIINVTSVTLMFPF